MKAWFLWGLRIYVTESAGGGVGVGVVLPLLLVFIIAMLQQFHNPSSPYRHLVFRVAIFLRLHGKSLNG